MRFSYQFPEPREFTPRDPGLRRGSQRHNKKPLACRVQKIWHHPWTDGAFSNFRLWLQMLVPTSEER